MLFLWWLNQPKYFDLSKTAFNHSQLCCFHFITGTHLIHLCFLTWCKFLQKCWLIPCVKINQLPKVVSASSPPLPPLPFLISTIYCCHTQMPDCHFSTPFFLHLFLSHFNTSTSRGPCSSIHTAVPSRSLAHPVLIHCPLLPMSSISPSFLPATPCFFSPPLPLLSLHPSDWVMAIRAWSHPAAVCDRHWSHTQSLWAEGTPIHFIHGLTHTVFSKLRQLQVPKWYKWRYSHLFGVKGWLCCDFNNCIPTIFTFHFTVLWDTWKK